MEQRPVFEVQATVRVQRGTATHCACGGKLLKLPRDLWWCPDCGREYE